MDYKDINSKRSKKTHKTYYNNKTSSPKST